MSAATTVWHRWRVAQSGGTLETKGPVAFWRRVVQWLLAIEFLAVDVTWNGQFFPDRLGIDAHIYQMAARAWLTGQDPWGATWQGYLFAAPPMTLLPYAPFAWLPPDAFVLGMTLVSAGAVRAQVFVPFRFGGVLRPHEPADHGRWHWFGGHAVATFPARYSDAIRVIVSRIATRKGTPEKYR